MAFQRKPPLLQKNVLNTSCPNINSFKNNNNNDTNHPTIVQNSNPNHFFIEKKEASSPFFQQKMNYVNNKQKSNINQSFTYGKTNFHDNANNNTSFIEIYEKSENYPNLRNRSKSPINNNNSYRIYMPNLNSETPKFIGLKTFHTKFSVSPIDSHILGENKLKMNENMNPNKNQEANASMIKKNYQVKQINNLSENEKKTGIKIIQSSTSQHNNLKDLLNWKYGDQNKYNKQILKKRTASQNILDHSENFSKENNFDIKINDQIYNRKQENALRKKIMPPSIEMLFPKEDKTSDNYHKKHNHPYQKLIFEGDYKFWYEKREQKNENEDNVKVIEKVNTIKYKDFCEHIKKEKNSMEKWIEKKERDFSEINFKQAKNGRKQFPSSSTFKTNIILG